MHVAWRYVSARSPPSPTPNPCPHSRPYLMRPCTRVCPEESFPTGGGRGWPASVQEVSNWWTWQQSHGKEWRIPLVRSVPELRLISPDGWKDWFRFCYSSYRIRHGKVDNGTLQWGPRRDRRSTWLGNRWVLAHGRCLCVASPAFRRVCGQRCSHKSLEPGWFFASPVYQSFSFLSFNS